MWKTHFGSSRIFVKEEKRWSTIAQWKTLQSLLSPLHLLHLSSALITLDEAKKFFKDNDEERETEAGEISSDDHKSVFDLIVPSPSEPPKENSPNLISLILPDWKESQSDKPTGLRYMLRKVFIPLKNSLVPFIKKSFGQSRVRRVVAILLGNHCEDETLNFLYPRDLARFHTLFVYSNFVDYSNNERVKFQFLRSLTFRQQVKDKDLTIMFPYGNRAFTNL